MRPILVVVLSFTGACSVVHRSELDETLEWMDNTYNRHDKVSGAYGHGRSAWYARSSDSMKESMVSGRTESFTYRGCEMTVRIQELPRTDRAQELISASTVTFNLKDIDPSSIKVTALSHFGGFSCETVPGEKPSLMAENCDHAEMSFSTRSAAGLIHEESHTCIPEACRE